MITKVRGDEMERGTGVRLLAEDDMRLVSVLASSSQEYGLRLDAETTVGDLARYLSHAEAYVETTTLEWVAALDETMRVGDIDRLAGDRLLIFTSPPRRADLPLLGGRAIKFIQGEIEITARGKKRLLLGKPDEGKGVLPDVDLRNFVPPRWLSFISRECLGLEYDDQAGKWFAQKLGVTRILIDDYELTTERIPLEGVRRLRLYRHHDDPFDSYPLSELRVQVEGGERDTSLPLLREGDQPTRVRIGVEREPQLLNVSENVTLERILEGWTAYNRLNSPARLYLARLISPDIPLYNLPMEGEVFLYAGRSRLSEQNILLLRDVANPHRIYRLIGGVESDETLIGSRDEQHTPDVTLGIDLFDAVVADGGDPAEMSRYQACVYYKDQTWWLRAEERTAAPMYLNSQRINSPAPLALSSGDVLTIGEDLNNYLVRLVAETTAQGG